MDRSNLPQASSIHRAAKSVKNLTAIAIIGFVGSMSAQTLQTISFNYEGETMGGAPSLGS